LFAVPVSFQGDVDGDGVGVGDSEVDLPPGRLLQVKSDRAPNGFDRIVAGLHIIHLKRQNPALPIPLGLVEGRV